MKLPIHLFDWPSRHNVHLALPLLLFLSFVLHASCVLIFQIYYPRAQAPALRSAQVYYLEPGSPEAKALAPLLEAADPALFSPAEPLGPSMTKLPGSEYVASFENQDTVLEPLPATEQDNRPALAPFRVESAFPAPSATPVPGLLTQVRLGGGLADRKLTPPTDFIFNAPFQSIASVEFLVEVSPDGTPRHVIPVYPADGSGVEAIDRSALAYLLQSKFSPVEGASDPVWGTAKFLWGTDVQRRREP
jgi:hypothetical protein